MATAEGYIAFVDVLGGAVMYAVLLIVMLNHYVFARPADARDRRLDGRAPDPLDAVLALAFMPVLRLISIAVPVAGLPEAYQYALVAAPLVAGIAWAAWVVRLPGARFGFRPLALQLLLAFAGVPLGLTAYLLLRPESLAEGDSGRALVVGALAVSVVAALEEIIFRGFIQEACASVYGHSQAPLWSTAVYGVSYLGVQRLEVVGLALLLGLLFGWGVQRTRSLFGVTIGHCFVNVGFLVLWPALGA